MFYSFYISTPKATLKATPKATLKATPATCALPAARWTFLRRNAWVAALSSALIVVQAGRRSGALSTAAHALRMNRPVWVVPGPLDAPLHRGCHQLVVRGARVLSSVEAWAEALPGPVTRGEYFRTDKTSSSAPRRFP